MKLYLRLFWLFVSSRWKGQCDILDSVVTCVRVFPNDLDLFMHVNNGVYLTYADLGRTDLMLRAGAIGKLRRKGWYPVAARAYVEYRRSLKLWQKVNITTRIIGWDEKSFFLEQVFNRGDTHIATLTIDARFLSTSGERIGSAQLMQLMEAGDRQSPDTSQLPWNSSP